MSEVCIDDHTLYHYTDNKDPIYQYIQGMKNLYLIRLIPGTELTESQLNEKVMSQLLLHKMVAEDKSDSHNKILSKRSQLEENHLTHKSATFDDTHVSDVEAEVDETEMKDSGRGSTADLGLTDVEFDDLLNDVGTQTRKSDVETRTDSSLFYRYSLFTLLEIFLMHTWWTNSLLLCSEYFLQHHRLHFINSDKRRSQTTDHHGGTGETSPCQIYWSQTTMVHIEKVRSKRQQCPNQ